VPFGLAGGLRVRPHGWHRFLPRPTMYTRAKALVHVLPWRLIGIKRVLPGRETDAGSDSARLR
jgi:hypothetical protein